ncbi:unnamed protein product, partial [marine sediment metagenome]
MNSIDNIYCIHLKDRSDRKISIDKTAKHHNNEYSNILIESAAEAGNTNIVKYLLNLDASLLKYS